MKLLKWILIGGAIAWLWNALRGRQTKALPPSSSPERSNTL
jgi:hypothetical protein